MTSVQQDNNILINAISDIRKIITQSRENAIHAIDFQRVLMYWHIGRRIFEEEQDGKKRADYGTFMIKKLAEQLEPEFGSGFSYRMLNLYRQFYKTFPIMNALRSQLNWTQYKMIIRIDDESKREYYMAECVKNNWTSRQLERQINSLLYERLLLSNDKEKVLAVARGEELPEDPRQIIKSPIVLEFLGLKREAAYYEKDIETVIISHLQEFILELGNGFSFVARQKRIHLDGDDFFVDLVFYNRLLRCFVIIEIKTHKLTHQDIGQLQMYVNYYDRNEKLPYETPTIGILLGTDKNDTVVRYSLPENQKQILAAEYALYLPDKQQLAEELKRFTKELFTADEE